MADEYFEILKNSQGGYWWRLKDGNANNIEADRRPVTDTYSPPRSRNAATSSVGQRSRPASSGQR